MTSDIQSTAEKGRRAVVDALRACGAEVTEFRRGNRHLFEIRHPGTGQRLHLRVKARTAGTWQGSIRDADPDPAPGHPETFWVFVDLEDAARPQFFIVPDGWMRQDIHREHQVYLDRHGGERAITKDSTHHAIQPRRILQWRDRWDLLGLEDPASPEHARVVDDIRVADEQIARGEGVEHDEGRRGILARLHDRLGRGRRSR